MACECLDRIDKEIRAKLDPAAMFERVFSVSNDVDVMPGTYQFKYRKKKGDGTFEKKWTKSFVAFSHCPFCGKKYESDGNERV